MVSYQNVLFFLLSLFFTDNEDPVFFGTPSNISQNTDANSPTAVVKWTPPSATDNADEALTLTSSHNPNDSFVIGTTKVSYTATDPYGNSATTSFNVLIIGKFDTPMLRVFRHPQVGAYTVLGLYENQWRNATRWAWWVSRPLQRPKLRYNKENGKIRKH